jgi:hypothetical protein
MSKQAIRKNNQKYGGLSYYSALLKFEWVAPIPWVPHRGVKLESSYG